MSNEVEISEELVEEIDEIYKGELGQGVLALKNTVGLVNERDRQKEIKGWQQVITRILSAVRDDKQKIPGEVGRITTRADDIIGPSTRLAEWVGKMLPDQTVTFIALKPKEASDAIPKR